MSGFNLQSGAALGAGADALQEQLKMMFDQAIKKQAMAQDAKRLQIEQQRADDERAYRTSSMKSLDESRNASAQAAATTKALRIASSLAPGRTVDTPTIDALKAGDMGDLVEHKDATLGSRNLSGVAQAGAAPRILGLASTANPGQAAKDVYTGTDAQLQGQEDRQTRAAQIAQARQDKIDAAAQAARDRADAAAQSAADRENLARVTAGLRGGNNDLQREILQGKIDANQQKSADAKKTSDNARNTALASIDDTSSALDELVDAQGNLKPGVGGAVGWDALRSSIPGTAAADAKARIDRLQSRLTVDLLGEMKRQSRTGASGFGALSEKELAVLQNAAARLGTNQSDESFRQSLLEVRKHLASMRQRASGGVSSTGQPTAQDLIKKYGGGG